MITILCSPKPFVNEAAWNQLNALRSWRAIHPDVEIIIFGAPPGTAEVAEEVNAKLVPEIECSSSGAPSFNAMTSYAAQHGRHDLQVYVNCDIIMNGTIYSALTAAHERFEKFLLVGERLDLANTTCIDVRENNWVARLEPLAESGQLTSHGPTGADYFGFVRGMWNGLPPVFMGRAMCDQSLLHYSFMRKLPVIDATLAILALHQHHDYRHIPGGRAEVFTGADFVLMSNAHKLHHSLPTVVDANWRFGCNSCIEPNHRPGYFLRKVEMYLRYHSRIELAAMFVRLLQRLGGKRVVAPHIRSVKTILLTLKDKYTQPSI